MPSVTITLTDTPNGGVAVHSSFHPRIGQPLTPCQQYALDVIARTHRTWGVAQSAGGVDIDAVHRRRDNVVSQ